METVGIVGVGKIGLPIAENLIKSGYRVLGYRRSSLADFEKIGGVAAKSPAAIGAATDMVFSCVPTAEALHEVVQGRGGLVHSARPGMIVTELGSHSVADKARHIKPLAARGAAFVDGEVSGTPGMVAARKGVIYLGGDAEACKKVERVVAGFADSCVYFGPFGAASKVKLVNNLLVALNIAATAEAMALGLKAGVDVPTMIKAVATGSGGSTQFGIRAPWMAERRFAPAQGTVPALQHYFDLIGEFADSVGVATPLLDRAVELYGRFMKMGFGEKDVAAMVDVIGAMPRDRAKRKKVARAKAKARPKAKPRTKAKAKTKTKTKTKSRRRAA
jgi:3-hydroxyisobutyrate dehydrogenase